MGSESDSDTVISKRPKTKTKIGKEISGSSDSEEHSGDLVQENKKDKSVFGKDSLFEQKKAIKRTRESEEESSISSDDEAMSKKRIRKNSEDECISVRPKKVVSAAARRRREAAETVRERKMAAVETDSECDSDEVLEMSLKTFKKNDNSDSSNKSEEGTISNAKQNSDFEDKKVSRNSECHVSNVKEDKSRREKILEKTDIKNEDSSSAYNSDSENGEKSKESFKNVTCRGKEKKSDTDKIPVKSPKRKSSLSDKKKSIKCVDSGSDADDSKHKRKINSTRHKEQVSGNENLSERSDDSKDDSDEDRIQSPVGDIKTSAGNNRSEALDRNSSKCSPQHKGKSKISITTQLSESDSEEKISEKTSVLGSKVIHDGSTKTKNKGGPAHSLGNENICISNSDSSNENRPLKKNKPTSKEMKIKKKDQSTRLSSNEDSSDSDVEKPNKNSKAAREQKKTVKSDKVTKKNIKTENLSPCENTSDSDRPVKKSKSSVKKIDSSDKGKVRLSQQNRSDSSSNDEASNDDYHKKSKSSEQKDVQRKSKDFKQVLKGQNYSPEGSSSEDEQPLKKTKSSTTNVQTFSDSEKSDDSSCDLKSKKETEIKKIDSESSDNMSHNCKSSQKAKPPKNNKTQETQLKTKVTAKKHKSRQKTSDTTSDSEEEPKQCQEEKISQKVDDKNGRSKMNSMKSSRMSSDEAGDSSDDSDLLSKKSKESKGEHMHKKSDSEIKKKEMQKNYNVRELSDSDRESDSGKKQLKNSTKNKSEQIQKDLSDSELSSEGKNSDSKCNKSPEVTKVAKEEDSGDSDTRELSNVKIKHEISDSVDSSDSEDNEKNQKDSVEKSVKRKESDKKKSSSSDSDSDSNKHDNKRTKKALGKMDVRINNLKKYVRACGIRINNYTTFWEGCKSDKQRADKLSKLLEDHGMKGRPTLQKCKKLRVKVEKKREVEELDLSNIIDTEENSSRYRCRSSRKDVNEKKPSQMWKEKKAAEKTADLKQRFSRIKDLIDSDSSSG